MKDALQPYFKKRDFAVTSEPQGGKAVFRRARVRGPEACGEPPALRLPPRARRHAQELGGAEGAEPRPRRQADGGPRRGSPDRLRRLRGRDPEGPVRRRQRDRLGQRHLGAGRRRARRLPRRQAQVPPPGQEAARRLDAGADARPRRRAPGAVAADQGARRIRAAGGRLQRRRCRAGERDLGSDHRRSAENGGEGGRQGAAARSRQDRGESARDRQGGRRGTVARRPRIRASAGAAAGGRGQGGAAAGPRAAAGDAGRRSAERHGLALRDQVRRLPHPGADRRRRRSPVHAPRQRLVGADAGAGRGHQVARRRLGLARRRDHRLRRPRRARLQRAAERVRLGAHRVDPVLRLRPALLRRPRSARGAAARAPRDCSRRCSTGRRRRSASASARTSTRAPRSCCRTPAGCGSKE